LRAASHALAEQSIIAIGDVGAGRSIMDRHGKAESARVAVSHVIAIRHGAAAGDAIAEILHLGISDVAAVRWEVGRNRHAVAGQLKIPVRHGLAGSLREL